ncbi:MAG: hypothetical protein WBF67_04880, partial [Olleya sp.]
DNPYDSNYKYERIKISNSNYEEDDLLEAIKKIQERQEVLKNGTTINEDEVEETVIESSKRNEPDNNKITLPDRNSRSKQSDHVRFIYTLKLKTNRVDESVGSANSVELNSFTNPYPSTFNLLNSSETKSNNSNYRLIKNNSNKDLIVFRLTPGIDESVFIPIDETIYLNLRKGDSILFYTGNNFTLDKLSHFKDNAELSKLYLIEDLAGNSNQEINVLPYRISTYKSKILNSDQEEIKETKSDVIESKNITLRDINIDKVYINWYKKKYN